VAELSDMNSREFLTLIPMIILIFWIGVYPTPFLGFMHETVSHLLERVNTGSGMEIRVAEHIMESIK
jgi:NADH-quinone oxidoreductase subunit M